MNKRFFSSLAIFCVGALISIFLFNLFYTPHKATKRTDSNNNITVSSKKWTCPMHPHIIRNKKGNCPICGMSLTPISNSSNTNNISLSENTITQIGVKTTLVSLSNNLTSFKTLYYGMLKEPEQSISSQVSHFAGRIDRLFISHNGEFIRKGQAIASIYSPGLVSAQQELITTNKESLPLLYTAAKNKLLLKKVPLHLITKIEKTKKPQTNFTLYSEYTGIIQSLSIKNGHHVTTGQPLFNISNLNVLWADFDIYESELSFFELGQAVSITSRPFPKNKFSGHLSFISPTIDPNNRTIRIRAEIQNPSLKLKPGGYITGIVKKTLNNVLLIPKTAVLWTGHRSFVYIKTKDGSSNSFIATPVTLGEVVNNTLYTIIKGLNIGDEIVTEGVFLIDSEAQLKNFPSMMNNEN